MTSCIKEFFDPQTSQLSYVVYDADTKDAVVIDPVWDYDPAASRVSTKIIDAMLNFVAQQALTVHLLLETHAHADHLSGAQVIKRKIPSARTVIGWQITETQKTFKKIFNLDDSFAVDGSQFDILIHDGESIDAGSLHIRALHTPGHTPACMTYLIDDAAFTGDALFMPDYGVGRCDFPAGSAERLYDSVHQKLYALPESTRVFTGHDYQPGGRPLRFESSIGEQKRDNIQLNQTTTREAFIDFRKERDATLAAPRLLFASVQVNIRAGHLPTTESNGVNYMKIPIRLSAGS